MNASQIDTSNTFGFFTVRSRKLSHMSIADRIVVRCLPCFGVEVWAIFFEESSEGVDLSTKGLVVGECVFGGTGDSGYPRFRKRLARKQEGRGKRAMIEVPQEVPEHPRR